jgi:tRNA U54 and U55 pseudouridine synthase Pus10
MEETMRMAWAIVALGAVLCTSGCKTANSKPDLVIVVEYQPFKNELRDHPVRVRAEYRPFGAEVRKPDRKRD